MIRITIDGQTRSFEQGITVQTAVDALAGRDYPVLGCIAGGVAYELQQQLYRDTSLKTLTYQDDEGRRIYERSLRFLMLMAARHIWPGLRIRIEHSLGYGLYVTVREHAVTSEELRHLQQEMRRLCQENLPYRKERWSRTRAIEYFAAQGEPDKVRLLRYRPYQHIYMYTCQDMCEYFYGSMLPGTGATKVFSLKLNRPGFILQMPKPAFPDRISAAARLPKHLVTFRESNEWCRILRCTNITDLNDMILRDELRSFIRVNEALQDKSIAGIADGIYKHGSRAVFIAGPSSSGKTTFANRLGIHLRVHGLMPMLISLDDFYRPRREIPLQANGEPDFEHLDAINVELFRTCVQALLDGDEVRLPRYSFGKDQPDNWYPPVRLSDDQVLIIEGIHALNPAVNSCFDQSKITRVFISELTCLNLDDHNRIRTTDARLLRRIVRDYQFRGTLPNDTLSMWSNVRAGEETWIFPFQEQADYVFNSVLHYELPFLRNIAYDLLDAIEPENPNYLAAKRLIKILHYLIPAPKAAQNEIPPTSILREFIGGCSFYS